MKCCRWRLSPTTPLEMTTGALSPQVQRRSVPLDLTICAPQRGARPSARTARQTVTHSLPRGSRCDRAAGPPYRALTPSRRGMGRGDTGRLWSGACVHVAQRLDAVVQRPARPATRPSGMTLRRVEHVVWPERPERDRPWPANGRCYRAPIAGKAAATTRTRRIPPLRSSRRKADKTLRRQPP